MTYQSRSPSELTDADLVEAIDYWEEYRDLVSGAEPILAVSAAATPAPAGHTAG